VHVPPDEQSVRRPQEGGSSAPKQDAAAGAAAAGELVDTWALPENTGRAYAALDGDISPMHLYKATALLMGFPAPVANVHLLAARTEASIAAKRGASRVCGGGVVVVAEAVGALHERRGPAVRCCCCCCSGLAGARGAAHAGA
jgi:acyl dehydratase